jgi:hypothetical protein
MELSYHKEPFLHITCKFDEDFYNKVKQSWNNVNHENYIEYAGNRSNIEVEDLNIRSVMTDFMFHCYDNFVNELVLHYPKLIEHEFHLKPRILYSENKVSEDPYKIRGWHLDTGDKFLIGLWYFKDENEEENRGGDLLLMNPQTKEVKKFEYSSNSLIIFPNLPTSWHAVTNRLPSKFPRRYVNLLLESTDLKLHNYQRAASSVDSEFRGKFINYYK